MGNFGSGRVLYQRGRVSWSNDCDPKIVSFGDGEPRTNRHTENPPPPPPCYGVVVGANPLSRISNRTDTTPFSDHYDLFRGGCLMVVVMLGLSVSLLAFGYNDLLSRKTICVVDHSRFYETW